MTKEEKHQCGHCEKVFKTKKTLKQHVNRLHPQEPPSQQEKPASEQEKPASEQEKPASQKKKISKEKRCERCGKLVGDLARHLKEFCRHKEGNLAECPHCKAMIPKSKLKEHIEGRQVKATGVKTRKGCKEKHSGDEGPAMEVCPICFKSVKVTYAARHRAIFHAGEDEKKFRQNEDAKKPVEQQKKIFISREFFLAALEEAQLNAALNASKDDLKPHQMQAQMIDLGLAFMTERGFQLQPPPRLVPMDGNCSFSMIALARDPSLGALDLHMEATQLRRNSIAWVIEMIRTLDEEGLQRVRLVATPETKFGEPAVFLTREELMKRLAIFAENGEYAGNLGDLLLYVIAAFIKVPILIVDVNHPDTPLGLFVSPRTLFGTQPVTNVPFVGVRRRNHFEGLLVPEHARIPLMEMYAAEEPNVNEICGTDSCSNVDGATSKEGGRREQQGAGVGGMRRDHEGAGGSRPDQSPHRTDTLAEPISTQGDRKNLSSFLPQLSPEFESKIRDLMKELDRVYINSPATIREMEKAQREIQVVYAT